MSGIRSSSANSLHVVVVVCLLSLQVPFCYYCWKDVKAPDGFVRTLICSPAVAGFGASNWLHYEFFLSTSSEKIENPSVAALPHTRALRRRAQTIRVSRGDTPIAKVATWLEENLERIVGGAICVALFAGLAISIRWLWRKTRGV